MPSVDDPAAELREVEQALADLRLEAHELRLAMAEPSAAGNEGKLQVSLETHEDLIRRFESRAEALRASSAGPRPDPSLD